MKIPYFRLKLEYLLQSGRNPDVRDQSQLAAWLDVSKSSVSNWLGGTGGMQTSAVPDKHIHAMCQCFTIDPLVFLGDHPPEKFEALVQESSDGWVQLLKLSDLQPEMLKIELEATNFEVGLRGVFQHRNNSLDGMLTLPQSCNFRLRLDVVVGTHLLLLLQDPEKIEYLELRELANLRTDEALHSCLHLPELNQHPFTTGRPAGQHQWLLLMTNKVLPQSVLESLTVTPYAVRNDTLKQLAWEVRHRRRTQGVDSARVIRCPFIVSS